MNTTTRQERIRARSAASRMPGFARHNRESASAIKQIVAEAFEITVETMLIRGRRGAWPRQVATYFMRQLTHLTLVEIGAECGGQDHGTVLNSERAVNDAIDSYPAVAKEINTLGERITNALDGMI